MNKTRKEKVKILIISGPNLNLLGLREEDHYGKITYQQLKDAIQYAFKDIKFEFYQSNYEGKLIDKIHKSIKKNFTGAIINLGGYSHTSVALRDAVELLNILKVEVHLSNIYEREPFRQTSLIKDVTNYQIVGRREKGYFEAIDWILDKVSK